MIDTHCHLTFPEFKDRTAEVLSQAAAAGVSGCVTISTTIPDAFEAHAIAQKHARVWSTVGVHPLYSDQGPHEWKQAALLARQEKVVAFGELGLDNHYAEPIKSVQLKVLEEQLAFIRSCWDEADATAGGKGWRKPIVLHCREAFAELIPILRASGLDAGKMVFHCFTGTPEEMRALLDFGALVSFTGVVTYKSAKALREAAKLPPSDRIMVETDAPFLVPEPLRGKVGKGKGGGGCEPWMVKHTLAALAELRGEDEAALHATINATTARFFSLPDVT
ncbi:MAG: TatD family hydrolase [Phycisphaerales bacterium]|nr:TatD family hydrolase [Phycisphaerales bacterium]